MADYKVRNIKEMHLWLEIRISNLYILLYCILISVADNTISKMCFTVLSIVSIIFGIIKRRILLKENKKIN